MKYIEKYKHENEFETVISEEKFYEKLSGYYKDIGLIKDAPPGCIYQTPFAYYWKEKE